MNTTLTAAHLADAITVMQQAERLLDTVCNQRPDPTHVGRLQAALYSAAVALRIHGLEPIGVEVAP